MSASDYSLAFEAGSVRVLVPGPVLATEDAPVPAQMDARFGA
jgi:hypothetical protein